MPKGCSPLSVITLNGHGLHSPIKRKKLTELNKPKKSCDPNICHLHESDSLCLNKMKTRLRMYILFFKKDKTSTKQIYSLLKYSLMCAPLVEYRVRDH